MNVCVGCFHTCPDVAGIVVLVAFDDFTMHRVHICCTGFILNCICIYILLLLGLSSIWSTCRELGQVCACVYLVVDSCY